MAKSKSAHDARVLDRLFATIGKRRRASPRVSYTAKLLQGGLDKIGGHVIEEAAETVAAALGETPARVAAESADTLYHLLVLWVAAKVRPGQVWAELARREGTSGLAEKKSRRKRKGGKKK
ncbi:MAG: phosphoribosyl-ATP diphosphatase [Pseudomonadota bacterium]